MPIWNHHQFFCLIKTGSKTDTFELMGGLSLVFLHMPVVQNSFFAQENHML